MALRLLPRRATRPTPDAMTLSEHIAELRRRVTVSVLAFGVAAVLAWFLYPQLVSWLQHPYCQVSPGHCSFYVTRPLDGLSLRIKLSAYFGLFFASPIVLWELWRFITPGLNRNEKRYAIPFIAASLTLFCAGAAVAFLAFPHALQFLNTVGGPSLHQILDPNAYLSLIVALMAVFGLTFEFPVILVSLELAGVLSWRTLSSWRRWAIVLIVLGAAIVTPSGDPFSMLALAVPLYVFYEVSILIGRLLRR